MYYLTSTDQNAVIKAIDINNRPCLVVGIDGQELDIVQYASTRARDNDLTGRLDAARALGFEVTEVDVKTPAIMNLRNPEDGDVAAVGSLQTPGFSYLVFGTHNSVLIASVYRNPVELSESVEDQVADLISRGWSLTV